MVLCQRELKISGSNRDLPSTVCRSLSESCHFSNQARAFLISAIWRLADWPDGRHTSMCVCVTRDRSLITYTLCCTNADTNPMEVWSGSTRRNSGDSRREWQCRKCRSSTIWVALRFQRLYGQNEFIYLF